jgi:hydroxymethylbilane synthase
MRLGARKRIMALAQTEDIARRLLTVAPELGVETAKFESPP